MKKTSFHALSITIGLLCSTEGFSQASSATIEVNAGTSFTLRSVLLGGGYVL